MHFVLQFFPFLDSLFIVVSAILNYLQYNQPNPRHILKPHRFSTTSKNRFDSRMGNLHLMTSISNKHNAFYFVSNNFVKNNLPLSHFCNTYPGSGKPVILLIFLKIIAGSLNDKSNTKNEVFFPNFDCASKATGK
jgi:hypothetical protein